MKLGLLWHHSMNNYDEAEDEYDEYLVGIRDNTLVVLGVAGTTKKNYIVHNGRIPFVTTEYKQFTSLKDAEIFRNIAMKIYKQESQEVYVEANKVKREGNILINKSNKMIRDFNKKFINRVETFQEYFI